MCNLKGIQIYISTNSNSYYKLYWMQLILIKLNYTCNIELEIYFAPILVVSTFEGSILHDFLESFKLLEIGN